MSCLNDIFHTIPLHRTALCMHAAYLSLKECYYLDVTIYSVTIVADYRYLILLFKPSYVTLTNVPEKDFPKFEEFDLDGDGIVSFDEWQKFLVIQKAAEAKKAKAGKRLLQATAASNS